MSLPPTMSSPLPVQPPGRTAWQSVQTWTRLRRDLLGFFDHLARTYGDVAACSLGPHRFVLLSHPDTAREVLVHQADNFVKTRRFLRMRRVMGDGLLTSAGARHLEDRRRFLPAFTADRIAALCPAVHDEVRKLALSWSSGRVVSVLPTMVDLTLGVALRCLFGADNGINRAKLADAVRVSPAILRRIVHPFGPLEDVVPSPTTLRLRRAVKTLRNFGEQTAALGDNGMHQSDALLPSALGRDGGTFHDVDRVADHAVTFLLTGHETTAIALTWSLFLLARHPETQRRVLEECLLSLGAGPYSSHASAQLTTLKGAIAEARRLYPPVYAISRCAVRACTIAGFRIEEGTTVYINIHGIHRDARFFPEPESFRPERWAGRDPDLRSYSEFLPFGAGGRSCIGADFAWMEMMVVLSTLLRAFSFRCASDEDPGVAPTMTLRPRQPIVVKATALD